MKINGIQTVATAVNNTVQSNVLPTKNNSSVKFNDVLTNVANKLEKVVGDDSFAQIEKMQDKITKSKELDPKELLLYQIQVGQFGLRVELVSKLAESATYTLKKFDSQGG